MATLKDIFGWFASGKTPTASQFSETWKSFWHKSEKIDQTSVFGLPDALAEKASKGDLHNVVAGINLLGEKANEAAVKALDTAAKNDTWRAVDTGHYWKYNAVVDLAHPYDPANWLDVGEVIPSSVADKLDKGTFTGTASDLALRGNTSKNLSEVENIAVSADGKIDDFQKAVKTNLENDTYYISDTSGHVIAKFDSEGLHITSIAIYEDLIQKGIINAAFFEEIANKLDKGSFAGTAEDLFNQVAAVSGLNLVVKKDIVNNQSSGVANNYKGQFCICDAAGKVVFWIKEDGSIVANIESATLNYQEINSTTAKVEGTNKYSKVFFGESKLAGKNILAIGDSLTAAYKWQVKTAEILGATQITHALGGGGIITFVDGGTNSNGSLAALNSTDVLGKDAIVILGPYNERVLMGSIGIKTDMYPTQQTLWGKMNYMFKRIYQELTTANNLQCKIFFAGVHAYGAYQYNDKTAYQEYPSGTGYTGKDFSEKLKEICGWNGIEFIDLFNNSGINSYTWNKYQASSQPNATNYIGYSEGRGIGVNDPFPDLTTLNNSIVSSGFINGDKATVVGFVGYYTFNGTSFVPTSTSSYFPWVADQLHCSNDGYDLIGNYIASQINSFLNN